MIVEWDSKDRSPVRRLFEVYRRGRAIVLPALDQSRGHLWVDSVESPTVARLQLAIINALAGDSSNPDALELVQMIEPLQVVFRSDEGWSKIIRDQWGESLGHQNRTCFSPTHLDLEHLRDLREQIPSGYTLERMDLETIKRVDKRAAMHIPWFFGGSEDFYNNGIAYCIKSEGRVVSMASTFTPYTDIFEIQVDTFDPKHRGKGLATAVSAALIVFALENGMTPYWDAENEVSLHLALKLGYTDPDPWEAYYLKPEK